VFLDGFQLNGVVQGFLGALQVKAGDLKLPIVEVKQAQVVVGFACPLQFSVSFPQKIVGLLVGGIIGD
jgi:hypothetical protein